MSIFRRKMLQMLIKYLLAPKFHRQKTITEKRNTLEKLTKLAVVPKNTKIEKIQINGISAEWVSGKNVPADKIILYLHGGGYNTCSANTHRELSAHISIESCAKVLLLNYRLAPENPFPAALKDTISAYRWLIHNGYSNDNIALAGDSAGGGLCLAASISLRDQGEPAPSSIACISPWTDLKMSGGSINTHARIDPMLNHDVLQVMASSYIGNNDPRSPLISPVYANLKGLSPLLCQVGSAEILLDDSIRIIERAKNAGVDATLQIYDQMWHVWHLAVRLLPEAQKAVRDFGSFIKNHFIG